MVDEAGNWNTDPSKFSYNKAMYGVEIQGLRVTEKIYSEMIEYAFTKIERITERSKFRDFAWNSSNRFYTFFVQLLV